MTSRTLMAIAAAAVALPVGYAAADDPADTVRIESQTESRTSVSGAASGAVGTQQTLEGRLVDLHQFMTGQPMSASHRGAQVHHMWALETPAGLVILSDPHTRPAPAAAADAGDEVIERQAQVTRESTESEIKAGGRIETESRLSVEETETTVFGIERRELSAAQNRVKASGKLYNKGGVKYLAVSSMQPATSALREGRQQIERDTKIERRDPLDAAGAIEGEGDVEIEIERDD